MIEAGRDDDPASQRDVLRSTNPITCILLVDRSVNTAII